MINVFHVIQTFFLITEYRCIPLSEASKYIKKCSVIVPWYDIKGISVWCMNHSCYDCKCFADPSYCSDIDENLLYHKTSEVVSTQDTQACPYPVENKDVTPPLEPSCVIVNVNVNNVRWGRQYCWKLKEWHHSVELHSSRTCGYSSSKKRNCEETKHVTISGQSQDDSPERVMENVVQTLRYQKSKEYSQGVVPVSYESIGSVSPLELEKMVNLKNSNMESAKNSGFVPVLDLTSELLEENTHISNVLPKAQHSQLEPESMTKKRTISCEGLDPHVMKRRRFSDLVGGSLGARLNHPSDADVRNVQHPSCPKSQPPDAVSLNDLEDYMRKVAHYKSRQPSHIRSEDTEDKEQPTIARKPLSIVDMMLAEEKRGELELDLSARVPGNALLVAEGRFRKLINMNMIGIIGINRAGR